MFTCQAILFIQASGKLFKLVVNNSEDMINIDNTIVETTCYTFENLYN